MGMRATALQVLPSVEELMTMSLEAQPERKRQSDHTTKTLPAPSMLADAGNEVIDGTCGGVDGNASNRSPVFAVSGGTHDDVVGSAAGAEAAVGPYDEDLAGCASNDI